MKSPQLVGIKSELPATIASLLLEQGTERPNYLKLVTDSPKKSRRNTHCVVCKQPKTARGMICNHCYVAFRQTRVVLQCAWCNKEYEKVLAEYRKAFKRSDNPEFYCGLECSRAHHAVKNAGKCKTCGEPMPKRQGKDYCSDICRAPAFESLRTLKPIPCGFCQVEFKPFSHLTRFCSMDCKNKAHSRDMIGKGNPRYKDGTSNGLLFTLMRIPVLERDNYACVGCTDPERLIWLPRNDFPGFRSSLVIHHINEDRTNNQIFNLVTLCMECHMRHHKSHVTPFPWLEKYAQGASESMTSKLKDVITSLQARF